MPHAAPCKPPTSPVCDPPNEVHHGPDLKAVPNQGRAILTSFIKQVSAPRIVNPWIRHARFGAIYGFGVERMQAELRHTGRVRSRRIFRSCSDLKSTDRRSALCQREESPTASRDTSGAYNKPDAGLGSFRHVRAAVHAGYDAAGLQSLL